METLDQLDRERRQQKLSKRAKRRNLRRPIVVRALFVIAPLLTTIVRLGVEIIRVLRE